MDILTALLNFACVWSRGINELTSSLPPPVYKGEVITNELEAPYFQAYLATVEVKIIKCFTDETLILPGLFGYYEYYEMFDKGGDATYEGTATDVTAS